jgi:hypothetical protein
MVERPKIETTCGFDYVPLLTALQAGEFREADQLTRDALITLAGDKAVDRGYVYFTEVPNLPVEDMATIERLWQAYSGGKFGYAVQAQAYMSKKVNRNFETFFERIGWKKADGTLVRALGAQTTPMLRCTGVPAWQRLRRSGGARRQTGRPARFP